MLQKLLLYLVFFLIPGTVCIYFGRRMVDYNAKSYPRVYSPRMKLFSLLLLYFIGLLLIVWGLFDFVLGCSPTW